MVGPDKWHELEARMKALQIFEDDLVEKFILGSGSGGQKINKTSSCVYIKHLPSGLEVKCQKDRSRDVNRYLARKELCDKVAEKNYQIKSEKQKLTEKIRRQKRRRSRRSKEKMLATKKYRSEKKSLRHTPQGGEG